MSAIERSMPKIPPGKLRRLPDRRKRFIAEYLKDSNATQAAIRAGYSRRSAATEGMRLLRNAEIVSAIRDEQARLNERCRVTAEKTLRAFASIGYAHLGEFIEWKTEHGRRRLAPRDSADLSVDQLAAIQEISETEDGRLKFRLHDKQAALTALGRHLGLFDVGRIGDGEIETFLTAVLRLLERELGSGERLTAAVHELRTLAPKSSRPVAREATEPFLRANGDQIE
jgi:phage terminase small subunit